LAALSLKRAPAQNIPLAFAALTTVQKFAPVAQWAQGGVSGTHCPLPFGCSVGEHGGVAGTHWPLLSGCSPGAQGGVSGTHWPAWSSCWPGLHGGVAGTQCP